MSKPVCRTSLKGYEKALKDLMELALKVLVGALDKAVDLDESDKTRACNRVGLVLTNFTNSINSTILNFLETSKSPPHDLTTPLTGAVGKMLPSESFTRGTIKRTSGDLEKNSRAVATQADGIGSSCEVIDVSSSDYEDDDLVRTLSHTSEVKISESDSKRQKTVDKQLTLIEFRRKC